MPEAQVVFHHVGLLTDQPEVAARRLSRLGYRSGTAVFDALQQATLQLCHGPTGSATIELVTPAPGNAGLSRLLKKRADYMYHVCFSAPSFDAGLQALADGADDRISPISLPTPAVLFDGARVAFYLVPGLGLVELLERP